MNGITFQALFAKATTTVDGGWNITFSLTQQESKSVLQLSQLTECLLQVAVVPINTVEHTAESPLDIGDPIEKLLEQKEKEIF